jgi:apyrase
MAARAKVIEAGGKNHPCFAKGTKGLSYTYGDKAYSVEEVVEGGDFKRCSAAAYKALEHDKACGQPQEACGFNGAWRGKPTDMKRIYYVSSYFWDRAQDSGIIADKNALQWKTSPGVSLVETGM